MIDDARFNHRYINVNGVRLHFVEMGEGPVVLFLHGFPEFWYTWQNQLPVIADAGYRAVALDMRGFNESEKPNGIQSYRMQEVVSDIAALCQGLTNGPVILVGRDIGGIISWYVAMLHHELLSKLIIINGPFPAVFARKFWRSPQFLKSWYVFGHLLPWLPEFIWSAFNFAMLRFVLRHCTCNRNAFSEEEIDRHVEALAKPGALTAGLNYYRAVPIPFGLTTWSREAKPVTVPTLLIWGERDVSLTSSLIAGTEQWVKDLRIERLKDASHWPQNDSPKNVNRLILEFLRE